MTKYVYTIDRNRCLGCRSCVAACKVENNTPEGAFWMHVFQEEEGEYPNVRVRFRARPCQHCNNAPCVKVCPVGARHKRDVGFVLTDFERCIGCRLCQTACPYGVNYFNWEHPDDKQYYDWKKGEGDDINGSGKMRDFIGSSTPPYENPDLDKKYGEDERLVAGGSHYKGVMGKCTWCVHRVEQGKKPACVENCPGYALNFGDIEDPESEVSKLLARRTHYHLLEDLGTKPSVYYLD